MIRVVVATALLAFAFFALRSFPLGAALAKIRSFPLHTLAIVLGAALLQVAAQVSRLWLVFPRRHRPTWMSVARGFTFGQLVNMSLPARAGDVVKVVSIANDARGAPRVSERASVTDTTGALLADRMLDIGTMVLLGVFVSGALGHSLLPDPARFALAAVGLGAAGVVAWALVRRFRPSALIKARELGRACVASAKGLRSPKRLSRGVAIGCVAIAAEVVALTALSSALGVSLSIGAALQVLIVLCLGIAIPVSVANIGAFEASVVLGMSRFGVSTSNAIAIGTVHHAAQFLAVAVTAFLFWQRDRFAKRAERLVAEGRANASFVESKGTFEAS